MGSASSSQRSLKPKAESSKKSLTPVTGLSASMAAMNEPHDDIDEPTATVASEQQAAKGGQKQGVQDAPPGVVIPSLGASIRAIVERTDARPKDSVVPTTGELDTKLAKSIPLEWMRKYSIGIFEIDVQHKKLFDIIFTLQKLKDHNYDGAEAVIGGCIDYTKYHFATEEKLMKVAGYPGFPKQKSEHKTFVDKCLEAVYSFDFGDMPAIDRFSDFLFDWLVQHIQDSDHELGDWLLSPDNTDALDRVVKEGFIVEPPHSS
eukprot:m51a1_g13157 hypothetical protein (261) ;mRNA; f:37880-38905